MYFLFQNYKYLKINNYLNKTNSAKLYLSVKVNIKENLNQILIIKLKMNLNLK